MREYILQQLRNLSCIKGKQRTWISYLTDSQLYDLFLMLRNGENAKSIARLVQDAWGVNPESSIHALSQGVLKFKKRIAHLLISPTPCEDQNIYNPHFEELHDSENTLESLEYIARLHRNRIKSMLEEEERTGIKFPYLNRDLQALAAFEKVLIKQKTFEIYYEDPIKRKKLEKVQKRFGAWMDQIGEERRLKLANALTNCLEYIENNCEMMERLPDGTYRKIEHTK